MSVNKKLMIIFMIYVVLILIVTFVACTIIDRKTRQIEELNRDIKEYEWQLEQVPYIIESSLDSWCNNE